MTTLLIKKFDVIVIKNLYLSKQYGARRTVTLKCGLGVSQCHWKMVPFESLGMVSYSPSIVTMAVSLAISEIFSVKEWPYL